MTRWLLRARWPLTAAILLALLAAAVVGVADALMTWVAPEIARVTPTLACTVTLIARQQSPVHLLPTAQWTVRPVPWCSPSALRHDVEIALWGLVALVGLMVLSTKPIRKILATVWYWVQGVGRLVPGTTHGRARWATRRELRRRRRRRAHVPYLLGRRGRFVWARHAWLTNLEQNLHVLIIGQPGVGKSSALFSANMLRRALWRPRGWRLRRLLHKGDRRPSGVATDPKGEFYATTSKAFGTNGYIVRRLDFYDPHGAKYNPLAHMESESDMQRFAQLVIDNTGGRSDEPYWDNTAMLTIVAAIAHLNHLAQAQGRAAATLVELRDFVGRADYGAMQRELLQSVPTARRMAAQFMANVRKKPELEGSIQTGLPLRFQFLNDPEIAAATAGDDIDFAALADPSGPPWQVYVVLTRGREDILAPLTVSFFTQLFDTLVVKVANKAPHGTLARPVVVDLDEAGTIGKLGDLPAWANTVRSVGVWLRLATQTFGQLVTIYGELGAEAIAEAFQTHVYFGGATVQEHAAEWMSKQVGKATVVQRQANAGRDREEFLAGQGGVTRSEAGAELLTPDDIIRMPRHRMVVVPRHAYPYTLRSVPWDADKRLKRVAGQIGQGRSHQISPTLLTPATAAQEREQREHEWAEAGASLHARPVHVISWEYDL